MLGHSGGVTLLKTDHGQGMLADIPGSRYHV